MVADVILQPSATSSALSVGGIFPMYCSITSSHHLGCSDRQMIASRSSITHPPVAVRAAAASGLGRTMRSHDTSTIPPLTTKSRPARFRPIRARPSCPSARSRLGASHYSVADAARPLRGMRYPRTRQQPPQRRHSRFGIRSLRHHRHHHHVESPRRNRSIRPRLKERAHVATGRNVVGANVVHARHLHQVVR